MKRKLVICFIVVIVLTGLMQGCKRKGILTNGFNQVNDLKISYKDSTKTYSIDKHKDFINKIYNSIKKTEAQVHMNPGEADSQSSDPMFTIEIDYENGQKDIVKSTETGEFIYRTLDGKGSWTGGENTELAGLIKNYEVSLHFSDKQATTL